MRLKRYNFSLDSTEIIGFLWGLWAHTYLLPKSCTFCSSMHFLAIINSQFIRCGDYGKSSSTFLLHQLFSDKFYHHRSISAIFLTLQTVKLRALFKKISPANPFPFPPSTITQRKSRVPNSSTPKTQQQLRIASRFHSEFFFTIESKISMIVDLLVKIIATIISINVEIWAKHLIFENHGRHSPSIDDAASS